MKALKLMRIRNMLYVVDTHTEGEPTRIVLGGFPGVKGSTILEKRSYISENLDWLRTTLLLEPRGHSNQFGALLLPTNREDADYGLVFMDTAGYLDMCGHATIGVTTALIQTGMVQTQNGHTEVRYETAAGIITARAKTTDKSALAVSVVDVPSFHLGSYEIEIGDSRSIPIDIAYGGNFCTITDAKSLGARVRAVEIDKLLDIGIILRDESARRVSVSHPDFPENTMKIELAMITDEPELPDSSGKNIVVFGKRQFDRSPCVTGTAARLATMHSKNLIQIEELFIHESVINTVFKAKILETVKVGPYDAVIPEITGSAFITQISNPVIDPMDPLKEGFLAS